MMTPDLVSKKPLGTVLKPFIQAAEFEIKRDRGWLRGWLQTPQIYWQTHRTLACILCMTFNRESAD